MRMAVVGVFVRMVTGDNADTARAIAKECGILTDDGLVVEGPAFRAMTPAQVRHDGGIENVMEKDTICCLTWSLCALALVVW